MDCDNLDFSTMRPEDIFGLIATCGPQIITAWRRAIETDPNAAPPISPEVQLELQRLEREAAAEKARQETAKLAIFSAVIFATIFAFRR